MQDDPFRIERNTSRRLRNAIENSFRYFRHCEERSDEAIRLFLWLWIASLRSQ